MSTRKRASGEGPDILPLMNGEDMEHIYIHKDAYTGKALKVENRHRADSLKSSKSVGALSVFDPNTTGTLPRDTEIGLDIYEVIGPDGTPYRKSITESMYSTEAGGSTRQSRVSDAGQLTITRAYVVGDAGGGPGQVVARVTRDSEDTHATDHRTSRTNGVAVNSGAAGSGWVSDYESMSKGAHAKVQSASSTAEARGSEVTGAMASGPGLEKADSFQYKSSYSKLVSASPYGSPHGSQTKLNQIGRTSSPTGWRQSGDSATFAATSADVKRTDSSTSSTLAAAASSAAAAKRTESSGSSSHAKVAHTGSGVITTSEVAASGGSAMHVDGATGSRPTSVTSSSGKVGTRDSSTGVTVRTTSRKDSSSSRKSSGSRASTQSVTKSYMAQTSASSSRTAASRRDSSSRSPDRPVSHTSSGRRSSQDGRRLSSTDRSTERIERSHREGQLSQQSNRDSRQLIADSQTSISSKGSSQKDSKAKRPSSLSPDGHGSRQSIDTYKVDSQQSLVQQSSNIARRTSRSAGSKKEAPPPPVALVSKTHVTDQGSLERKRASGEQDKTFSDSSLTKKLTSRSSGLYSIQAASGPHDEGAGKFKRMPSNPNLENMGMSVAEVELSGMKSPVQDDQIKLQLSKLFGGSEAPGQTKITKSVTRREKRTEITKSEDEGATQGGAPGAASSSSDSESDHEDAAAPVKQKRTSLSAGAYVAPSFTPFNYGGNTSRSEVKTLVQEGSVQKLATSLKDLPLTGRGVDLTPPAKTLSTPTTPTSTKFKFAVEGIDVPAPPDEFKDEEYSSSAPNLNTELSTVTTTTTTYLDTETGEGNTDSLRRQQKQGFTYLLDNAVSKEVIKKAEDVTSRKPHESVEVKVQTKSKVKDNPEEIQSLRDARAKLQRQSRTTDSNRNSTATDFSELLVMNKPLASVDHKSESQISIDRHKSNFSTVHVEQTLSVAGENSKHSHDQQMSPDSAYDSSPVSPAHAENLKPTVTPSDPVEITVQQVAVSNEKPSSMVTTEKYGVATSIAQKSTDPVEISVQQVAVSNEKPSSNITSEKYGVATRITQKSTAGERPLSQAKRTSKEYSMKDYWNKTDERPISQAKRTSKEYSSKEYSSKEYSHKSAVAAVPTVEVTVHQEAIVGNEKLNTEATTEKHTFSSRNSATSGDTSFRRTFDEQSNKTVAAPGPAEVTVHQTLVSHEKPGTEKARINEVSRNSSHYSSTSKENISTSTSESIGDSTSNVSVKSETRGRDTIGVKSDARSQSKYQYGQSYSQYYSAKGGDAKHHVEGYATSKTVSTEETSTPEVYTKTTVVEHSHTISDPDDTPKTTPTTSKTRLVEHEHRDLKTSAINAKADANIVGPSGDIYSITTKTSSTERDVVAPREAATAEASVKRSADWAAGHTHTEVGPRHTEARSSNSAVTVATTASRRSIAEDRVPLRASTSAPSGRKASQFGAGFHPLYNHNRTLHFDAYERRPTGDSSLQKDIEKLNRDRFNVSSSIKETHTEDQNTQERILRVKDTGSKDKPGGGISNVPISTYVVKEEHKLSKVLSESGGHINYEPREYERSDFDRSYSSYSSSSDSDSASDILPEAEEVRMSQQGRQAGRKRSGLLVTTVSRGEVSQRQAPLPEETGFGPSTNRLGRITVTDGNVQVDLNQSQEFSPYDDNTLPPNFDYSHYPTNTFKSTKSYDAGENVFAVRESHLSSTTASSLSPQSSFGPASPVDERPQRIIKLRPIAVDISGMPVSPPGGRPGPGMLSPNVRHMQTTMEMSAMTGASHHNYNPGPVRVTTRAPTSPRIRRQERVRSEHTSSYHQDEVPINHVNDYTVERNAQLNFNVYAPNQKPLDQNHNVTTSQYHHSQSRRTQNHLSRLQLEDDVFDAGSVHSEPGRSIPVRTSSRRSPTSPLRPQVASQQVRALDIAQPLHVTLPAPPPLQHNPSEGMLSVAPTQATPLLSPTLQQVGGDTRGNYHISIKLNQLGSVTPLQGETNTLNRSMQETNTINRSSYEQTTMQSRRMQSQHTVHLSPPAPTSGPHKSVVKLRDEAPRAVHVGTASGHTTEQHSGHSTRTVHHADHSGAKMAMAVNQTLTMDYSPSKHANNTTTTSENTRTVLTQQTTNQTSSRRDQGEDETDNLPQVVRGSILIKNTLDTVGATKVIDLVETDDLGEELLVDDNTNLFHGKYYQARENPMYSSDEDLRQAGLRKPAFTEIFEKTSRSERREDIVDGGETFVEIPVDYRNGHLESSKKGQSAWHVTQLTTLRLSKMQIYCASIYIWTSVNSPSSVELLSYVRLMIDLFPLCTQKTKNCHDANFVTGGTTGCHYDNLWCRQWRRSWHHSNSVGSAVLLFTLAIRV